MTKSVFCERGEFKTCHNFTCHVSHAHLLLLPEPKIKSGPENHAHQRSGRFSIISHQPTHHQFIIPALAALAFPSTQPTHVIEPLTSLLTSNGHDRHGARGIMMMTIVKIVANKHRRRSRDPADAAENRRFLIFLINHTLTGVKFHRRLLEALILYDKQ